MRLAMHTRQPTDTVAHLRLTTPLRCSTLAAPDAGSVEDLEGLAVAAATSAALGVATRHWANHGGDLATHVRVALRALQNLQPDELASRVSPDNSRSIRPHAPLIAVQIDDTGAARGPACGSSG